VLNLNGRRVIKVKQDLYDKCMLHTNDCNPKIYDLRQLRTRKNVYM